MIARCLGKRLDRDRSRLERTFSYSSPGTVILYIYSR